MASNFIRRKLTSTECISVRFKDVYRLEQFLISDSSKILAIETCNVELELVRINNILEELESKNTTTPGKLVHNYVKREHQCLLNCNNLKKIFNYKNNDYSKLGCLIIVDLNENSLPKTIFKKFFHFIEENLNKKAILVSSFDMEFIRSDCEKLFTADFLLMERVFDISFQHLESRTQEMILNLQIICFRNVLKSLKDFLHIDNVLHPKLDTVINIDVVKYLILNQSGIIPLCKIINHHNNTENYTISRRFHSDILINDKISHLLSGQVNNIPDMFIIAGIKKDYDLTNIFKTQKKLTKKILENPNVLMLEDLQMARNKFEKYLNDRPIHLLQWQDEIGLLWIESKQSIELLKQFYSINKNCSINESNLFNKKIVVLNGDSGIGKSAMLAKVSQELKTFWTIWINLSENLNAIELLHGPITRKDVVNFISNFVNEHFLIRGLIEDALFDRSSQQVCLLFDGFDEIVNKLNTKTYNFFLDMLKFLRNNSRANIWVATRPERCSDVENALATFSTQFENIQLEEQKRFLSKIWKQKCIFNNITNELFLEQQAEKVCKSILDTKVNLGTPLFLQILAEIPLQEHSDIKHINIFDGLNQFIKNKYQQMSVSDVSLTTDYFDKISQKLETLSIQLLVSDYEHLPEKIIAADYKELLKTELVALLNNNLTFIHKTFAEYFVARWISMQLDAKSTKDIEILLFSKIFLESEYKVVRLFLNDLIKEKEHLFSNRVTKTLSNLWRNKQRIFFNKKSQWAMHIFIHENLHYLANSLINKIFIRKLISLFTSQDIDGKTALYLAIDKNQEKIIESIFICVRSLPDIFGQRVLWSTILGVSQCDSTIAKIVNKISEYFSILDINKHLHLDKYTEILKNCYDCVSENNLQSLKNNTINISLDILFYIFVQRYQPDGSTILHIAAAMGHTNIVHFLLDSNIPADILDYSGATPLHYASSNGHLEVVTVLIEKGADVNFTDKYLQSALILSAKRGHEAVVNNLLKKGANNKMRDRNGISSLAHAAKSGQEGVVKILLESGCDVNDKDRFGLSPLAWSVKAGKFAIVQLLMRQGADTTAVDRHGSNLLHLAVKSNHWGIVKYLIFNLVDPNIEDFNGITPIERTIKSGKWDMVKYLILEGAVAKKNEHTSFDPFSRVIDGKVNDDVAKWDIAILMIKRGSDIAHLTFKTKVQILKRIVSDTEDLLEQFSKVIKIGNVSLLEVLIGQYQLEDEQLDNLLAQPYEELLIQNVILPEQIKMFIEQKLIELRIKISKNLKMSAEDTQQRLKFICHQINYLKLKYGEDNFAEIDQEFIVRSQFICQLLEDLKLQKRFKDFKLEEIQFCLLIFINSFIKPANDDISYRLILDQSTIINYFIDFASSIQNKDTQNSSSEKSLIKDYRLVRDIYSLKRILTYINYALNIKDISNEMKPYALLRCLQVIGEYLKCTTDSPNLSEEVHNYLLYTAPEGVKDIFTSLRDSLSHSYKYKVKFNIESMLKEDASYFQNLQNDLRKVKSEVDFILYKKKTESMQEFHEKWLQCKHDKRKVEIIFRYTKSNIYETISFDNCETEELKTIKSLVIKIKLLTSTSNKKQLDIVKNLLIAINKINEFNNRTALYKLNQFQNINNIVHFESILLLRPVSCNMEKYKKQIMYRQAYSLILDIQNLNRTGQENEIRHICNKLLFILNFKTNKINSIKEMNNDFTELSKNNCHEIFEQIESLLDAKSDKCKLRDYINKNISVYDVAMNENLTTNERELIIKTLDLKPKTSENLLQFLKDNRMSNFYSLIGSIDYYGNLIKRETKDSFFQAVADFFKPVKNLNINDAVDKIIEKENTAFNTVHFEKFELLKKVIFNKNFNVFNQKNSLRLAIETLMLDIMDAFMTKKYLPEYSSTFEDYSPITINKRLRNYLAHGNILIDTLPYEIGRAIVGTIQYLDANIENIKKHKISPSLVNSTSKELKFEKLENILQQYRQKFSDSKFLDDIKGQLTKIIMKDVIDKFNLNTSFYSVNCFLNSSFCGSLVSIKKLLNCTFPRQSQTNVIFVNSKILWSGIAMASSNDQSDVVKLLLDYTNKNFDFNYKIAKGIVNTLQTSIKICDVTFELPADMPYPFIALVIATVKGYFDIIKILLDYFVSQDDNCASKAISLTLNVATIKGHKKIVNTLLKNYRNCNINYNELLEAAAMHGHTDICTLILKQNDKNIDKKTKIISVFLSARNGHYELIELLLENDTSLPVSEISDALNAAAANGFATIVDILLKKCNTVPITNPINGFGPLHYAALGGHIDVAKMLMKNPVYFPIDAKCHNGNTSLHLAALTGHEKFVEILLSNNCNVDVVNKECNTPLLISAENGYEKIVNLLLNNGADIEATNLNKSSALHFAAYLGHLKVVEILLERDLNVDMLNIHQITPLCMAVSNRQVSIVKLLLANNANFNAVKNSYYKAVAIAQTDEQIINLLLEHGANVDLLAVKECVEAENEKNLLILLNKINLTKEDLNYLLFQAVITSNEKIVNILFEKGADINFLLDNESPLHVASAGGFERVVKKLTDLNADVNILNNFKQGPLFMACKNENDKIVGLLLKNGAKVNAFDLHSETPLHWAVKYGNSKIAQILLKHGANVNVIDKEQTTPLHIAANLGNEIIVRMLLQWKAHTRRVNKSGNTPLLLAADKGYEDIVKLLLEKGSDINEMDFDRNTPLHVASRQGHEGIVKMLLQHETDVNAINADFSKPLHLACNHFHSKSIRQFTHYGHNTSLLPVQNFPGETYTLDDVPIDASIVIESEVTMNNSNILSNDIKFIIKHGCIAVIKLLLDHGANPNAEDGNGCTPLKYAVLKPSPIIQALLKENGATH